MNFLKTPPSWVTLSLKIGGIVIGLSCVGIVAVFAAAKAYDLAYQDRMFPGVFVLDQNLSGLSREAAAAQVRSRIDDAVKNSLIFTVADQTVSVEGKEQIIRYQPDLAVEQAFNVGRGSSLLQNTVGRIFLLAQPRRIAVPASIDRAAIEKNIREKIKDRLIAAQDAKLLVTVSAKDAAPTIAIQPEQVGHVIDLDPALRTVEQQAVKLAFVPIALQEAEMVPRLRTKDVEALAPNIPDWLSHAPFKLTAETYTWTVTPAMLASWTTVTSTTDGWTLGFDQEQVEKDLRELTRGILAEPIDGTLVLENGKMKEFVAPQQGMILNVERTVAAIENGWNNGSSTMPITIETVMPKITGKDAEEMGIREVLGVGRSNYVGSPSNRRKNITHGADLVNGVLIAPDEEFSMLKTLGEMNGAHGWLPELVIKGNKTTPEFGGGLCQIGTTTFRTALESGLPITERQNHSYRVVYYEPAGTDATIYDPKPDLKFKNDTGHWILATTQNVGSNLTFTFWGTHDGRVIKVAKPRIFNITAPPAKKVVETTDIPAGTTKCTESAHAGATAILDYAVTYPDGKTATTTFTSYYKPWGAVCLKGVTELTPTAAVPAAIDESGVNNPN